MNFNNKSNDFPPEEWKYFYKIFNELATWYAGDPDRLLNYYSVRHDLFPDTKLGYYWSMLEQEERKEAVHVPLAGDIAQMSANLLFSETPKTQFADKTEPGKRIDGFIHDSGFMNILLEGAELSAALSGLFLKLDYDSVLSEYPLLTIRNPANAFPTFQHGRLIAVTFHRVVKEDYSGAAWRIFESRYIQNDKLHIEYKLFKGSSDKLGREVGIQSINETADYRDEVLNIPVLGCVYIPNMRPNRIFPGSPVGESDYRDCIGLMDSLDFAWSSWMRDIEIGLGQLLVDDSVLESDGTFSKLRRAFVRLKMDNVRLASEGKYEPIKHVQFNMRIDEHMKTCDQLTRQIIGMSGYAPQTFGLVEYGQQKDSGTALRIRERKSLLTRQKKERYWLPELKRLLTQMQLFDGAKRGRVYTPEEINIVPEDSVVQDEKEKSETVRNLETAKAISTYTKIKYVHPDWSEDEVNKEVDRIRKEQGMGYADNPFESDVK
jgi:hypothetical protein